MAGQAPAPRRDQKTGRTFFSDLASEAFLSRCENLLPDLASSAYCSSHMGMAVMGVKKDILVNAWDTCGVDVIDFTKPRA